MKKFLRLGIFVASILLAYLSVMSIIAIVYGEHDAYDDDCGDDSRDDDDGDGDGDDGDDA